MPSHSEAQHRMFEAVEHDPEVARKLGISRQVAHEFTQADKDSSRWKRKEHVAHKAGMSPEIFNLISKA